MRRWDEIFRAVALPRAAVARAVAWAAAVARPVRSFRVEGEEHDIFTIRPRDDLRLVGKDLPRRVFLGEAPARRGGRRVDDVRVWEPGSDAAMLCDFGGPHVVCAVRPFQNAATPRGGVVPAIDAAVSRTTRRGEQVQLLAPITSPRRAADACPARAFSIQRAVLVVATRPVNDAADGGGVIGRVKSRADDREAFTGEPAAALLAALVASRWNVDEAPAARF